MINLSIITPVLNGVKFIEDNIKSILSLGDKVEHIIVDGGSTDGTLDILSKYENNIVILHQKERNGMYGAIDQGFKYAKGKYITWVNCDDRVIPTAYIGMLTFATSHSLDFVCSHGIIYDENTSLKKKAYSTKFAKYFLKKGLFPFIQPSTIYTKVCYNLVGGLDPKFRIAGDMILFYKMAQQNDFKFGLFDDFTSVFIKYGESLGDKNSHVAILERKQGNIPNVRLITKILFKLAKIVRI